MANDLIALVLRANLALAAGVAIVLLLRAPARRWFGARVAYVLWLLPVLAAGACFLPQRIEHLMTDEPLAPISTSLTPLAGSPEMPQLPPVFWLGIWCAGIVLSVAVLALRQGRFAHALGRLRPRADLGAGVFGAESCTHGPAVIGVLRPIIVTPADFDQRFSDEERRIVLAHERAHLAQGDPLINAFVVLLQCANWFNPFVHIGARALRLDQELAADAAVLATSARRPYAEAILKTQIATAAPLSAAWPPNSTQALKERISMLKRSLPSRSQRLLGVSSVALAAFGVCAVAWAAQPARVIVTTAPHIARADAAPFIEPPISDATLLAGAPQASAPRIAVSDTQTADAANDADDADDAADDADAEDDNDATPLVISDEAHLSPQERAEIRAQVRAATAEARAAARAAQSQAVREAIVQSRAAVAEARDAARAAQSEAVREALAESRAAIDEARIAAREAQAESVRAAVAAAREVNSPRVQAEIRAIAAQATQLARTQPHLTAEQRDEMRADIRARAEHLRALTHDAACPPDQATHND